MSYTIKLEPYKGIHSRHTCPQCHHKRCFTRYIDTENSVRFPNYVGRCNRENKCGYHYTPHEYFKEHPEATHQKQDSTAIARVTTPPQKLQPSFIESSIMQKTFSHYGGNNLVLFLIQKFGEKEAMKNIELYNVGTSKHWNGATIFWQQDIHGNIRTGKVMLYNPQTGKREKHPYNHITWVHSLLSIPDFHLNQCLFGEHLLRIFPDKPIALVESEKSAIISSFYLPDFLWLATGGKNGCFRERNISVLRNRLVVLFPDLGATDYWRSKIPMLNKLGCKVELFDFMEKNASDEERLCGLDIADFLLKKNSKEAMLQKMLQKNPCLGLLIKQFGLCLM